jgi:hypothetical protein
MEVLGLGVGVFSEKVTFVGVLYDEESIGGCRKWHT